MEANNTKAMHEALESIANNLERRLFAKHPSSATDEWMWQKANSALAAPPRNCDVGTPEEQSKRKQAYCKDCGCHGCPISACNTLLCDLGWAQMPYKEGDSNGNPHKERQ